MHSDPINNIYYILKLLVLADFEPPKEASTGGGGSGISVGVVIRIVAGGVFIILLLFGILWWKGFLRRERTLEQGISS